LMVFFTKPSEYCFSSRPKVVIMVKKTVFLVLVWVWKAVIFSPIQSGNLY
jgi:hypothetical protein